MANEGAKDPKSCQTFSTMWDLRSKVGEWDPRCTNAGPCRVACAGTRQVQPALTFDLSLRLGTWDSDLADPCPQLAGECGGTWVASGQKGGPVGRGPIFSLDLAPCEGIGSPTSPTSPQVRIVPSVSKQVVLAHRDKTSLIEEIIDLKRDVQDQQAHIRHHKIQASILEMENRKMARDIEDMERPNCQSKSTNPQRTVRLRAKIQALKSKIGTLESKADSQGDEINRLRTHGRLSHTREVELERDVFAGEIARLTMLVKRLKQLCNTTASLENRDEIGDMTQKAETLGNEHNKLEEGEERLKKELAKTEYNLKISRAKAAEDLMAARNAQKSCWELERKNSRVAAAIERTKKKNKLLAKKLSKTEKALRKAKGGFF